MRLRALASALAPGVLRLGGTLDKEIQYWLPHLDGTSTPPPSACRPGSNVSFLCLNASRSAPGTGCALRGYLLPRAARRGFSGSSARWLTESALRALAHKVGRD